MSVYVTPSATIPVMRSLVYVVEVIFPNHAAPISPPTTLFLQSVIEVMIVASETTTASLAYCPFHQLVEVWIAPAEFTMM